MTSSLHACTLVKDFLEVVKSDEQRSVQGRRVMEDKLWLYLWWKGKLSELTVEGKGSIALPKDKDQVDCGASGALKREDWDRQERQAKRRGVRGSGPGHPAAGPRRDEEASGDMGEVEIKGVTVLLELLKEFHHPLFLLGGLE